MDVNIQRMQLTYFTTMNGQSIQQMQPYSYNRDSCTYIHQQYKNRNKIQEKTDRKKKSFEVSQL